MNPLLLAKAAPYAIAALIAFALAWGIQSLRLTSANLAGNDAAINDCAVTTLQLNSLQADIEAQPGYKE